MKWNLSNILTDGENISKGLGVARDCDIHAHTYIHTFSTVAITAISVKRWNRVGLNDYNSAIS